MIDLRVEVARQLGGDRSKILSAAGLEEEQLSKPDGRISVEKAMKVWEVIVSQTGSQDIGLLSGKRMRLNSMGILGYLVMNSDNLKKALNKQFTYQRLVNSISFMTLIEDKGTVKLQYELQEPWQPLFRYTLDFMVAATANVFFENLYQPYKPVEVGFCFEQPANSAFYHQVFKTTNIHFNCTHTYISYPSALFALPIMGANPAFLSHFDKELELAISEHDSQSKYQREVKGLIQKQLKAEIPKVDDVARHIGVSTRALQQLLKTEGTSYQTLLNEVRKEVSLTQLRNKSFNITEVAFITGFSNLASFSRNFKKWTGQSPSQYQAAL